MDEMRGDHHQHNRNFNRGNRNRHFRGGGGGGRPQHRPGGGRSQRPLLTSALNGAGFSLVAVVLMAKDSVDRGMRCAAIACAVFAASAIISYLAQRVRFGFVEKISDLLFVAGVVILAAVALHVGGLI